MISRLKQLVPRPLIAIYHRCLAWLAAVVYRAPSRNLLLVGVTGTNGKTTSSVMIARGLEALGPSGLTSTALLKIADKTWVNATKMTMPGRFFLQSMLRKMVEKGCVSAVVETSSQGILQSRHQGIAYDIAVFTNLTPEHIEAHGGFENYKRAKRELFLHTARAPQKIRQGKPVPRAVVWNEEDVHAADMAKAFREALVSGMEAYDVSYSAKRIVVRRSSGDGVWHDEREYPVQIVEETGEGSVVRVGGATLRVRLAGRHNILNALASVAVCDVAGVDMQQAVERVGRVDSVPGRLEFVDKGQSFRVLIDYAPEPASMEALYATVASIPHARILHVFGKCGGGRDRASRGPLGALVASRADITIITNEDPYDDDPWEIIHEVAAGARGTGKKDGETLFEILDRGEAIHKAIAMAQPNDLILITGKGHEPWMCIANGKKIPWSDRGEAEKALQAKTTP